MGSTLFQKLDNQVLIQLRKGFFHKSGFPESPRPPNRTGAEYLCSGLTDKKYALCQSLSPSAGDGFPLKQNSQVFACQESELESVRNQPVTASSFIVGMPWKSHDIDIPTVDWKSGYYAFNFVEQSGRRYDDIAFIVVTNPLRKGDILVKLSTNTYQAYNKWGGGSLYSTILRGVPHADTVSFDRPTVSQFYRWEYYYVLWLEELANQLDFTVDYATNFDFYREPKIADEYKILISLGHDEYWSQEEFESHYDRIFALGKNTLFLGANSAYFRVRYGDIHGPQSWPNRGRQLICFKNSLADETRELGRLYDPVIYAEEGSGHATGLFRGQIGFPETMLMGVGFENNFPSDPSTRYTYYVNSVVPWLFEGTGLEVGDRLADVVGYQWDNISLIHNGVMVLSEPESRVPLPRRHP